MLQKELDNLIKYRIQEIKKIKRDIYINKNLDKKDAFNKVIQYYEFRNEIAEYLRENKFDYSLLTYGNQEFQRTKVRNSHIDEYFEMKTPNENKQIKESIC